jgi:peptidoglycan/LPS O-acetylase OafA/YrhL
VPDFFKNFFKSSHGSSFRTDIAGIRGIAVMLVVLCHFEIPGFGGGFIGPDIFFVLSGYLITGLLVKEYNKKISKRSGRGTISIGQFYLRRTRRILPASLFVLLCINIYARLNMNVLQVAQIRADSIWTVLFGANINFLRQATDYFAQNNAVSPLQHYWSLSVEEQFYFVWPVLFLTAASFHKLSFRGREFDWHQRLRAVFVALGIGSFAWMLIEFTTSPTTAYFSTFSRAWELAIGGALSLLSVERIAAKLGRAWTILRGAALATMVGSIAVVTPTNFGYTLVIPAVATGFLLISGAQAKDDPVYRLLSTKPLTALGAISFSMYLWHWPVFVFGRNLDLMNNLPQRIAGVVLCIALGTLSYWLIERTFLKIPLPTWKPRPNYNGRAGLATSRIFTSMVTVLVVAGLGLVTYPSSSASEGSQVTAWAPPTSAASYAPGGPSRVGLDQDNAGTAWTRDTQKAFLNSWLERLKIGIHTSKFPVDARPTFQELLSHPNPFAYCLPNLTIVKFTTYRCEKQGTGSHLALLIGDSHAAHLWPAFAGSLDSSYWRLVSLTHRACPATDMPIEVDASTRDCASSRNYWFSEVRRLRPDLLIISDNHNLGIGSTSVSARMGASAWRKTFAALRPYAKQIVVIAPTSTTANLARCVDRSGSIKGCALSMEHPLRSGQDDYLGGAASSFHVTVLSLQDALCFHGVCPPIIGNTIVTNDGNHFTHEFSQLLAPFVVIRLRSAGVFHLREFSSSK